MDTPQAWITILLVVLNAAFAIALDRSPSSGYQIGEPDSPQMYPLIPPPRGWRKLRRPVFLYATIITGIAIGITPMLLG
ncbi:hypothetical protein FIV07_12225 [Mycobacterium sp. THAF192]|nr:hypothetical protein FIV07_12225 [Mycobacterium sp. THAF192]